MKFALFSKESQCFFYNLKAKPIQRMLDFDYLSRRETPSIAAIIHPGRRGFHKAFFGKNEMLIPIFPDIHSAVEKNATVDSLINFASFRSAFTTSKEALLTESIKTITIVAEGIPERHTKQLIAVAKQKNKVIIGPATVGGIVAGQFRIGHAGGTNENIIRAKLYRPGSIGLVSRSGGMINELFNIISRSTDGIHEAIAIGGDQFPGSTLLEHMLRYEANPNIKMIVALGELGGHAEYEIIKAKKVGKLTKPIVMWVSGTCAGIFPWKVQFGHAGARADSEKETAAAKNQALGDAGIYVPKSFETLESEIGRVFKEIDGTKKLRGTNKEAEPPIIPARRKTNFTNTISDDRGKELTYNNHTITEVVQGSLGVHGGIGKTIGLLWFKKDLPQFFVEFLELAIKLAADHGPAVSGAHNAIVATRAGKDLISSLCSGLLTIGPKFGGAIDNACRHFREACAKGQTAQDFVSEMKKQSVLIPGIGHRIKSAKNPDSRVTILKEFARENFPQTTYLDFALAVEKETLKKADSLILNVDGCLAAMFLDALASSDFQKEDIQEIVQIGYMNGLFALSRSIGIIGHILDQKRLKEGLYRHPTEDILYFQQTSLNRDDEKH